MTRCFFWAPDEDIKTALETIEERCQLAFVGVPNETRKSLPDGITLFERVLPGADRMYPDTDSAPIPVHEEMIESARKDLPVDLSTRLQQLADWGIPADAYTYLLRNNLILGAGRAFCQAQYRAQAPGAALRAPAERHARPRSPALRPPRVEDLLIFVNKRKLQPDILPEMLKVLYEHPNMQFSSVLEVLGYKEIPATEILEQIPLLKAMWLRAKTRGLKKPDAIQHWIMEGSAKWLWVTFPCPSFI